MSAAPGPRRVGVEEEFLLVDPDSGAARADAPLVLAAVGAAAEAELQRQQVETGSAPQRHLGELRRDLAAARARVAEAAAADGALLVATGTHPLVTEPTTTEGERYQRMSARFGLLAREQLTCGCHVHVEVPDRDEAVAVVDRIRPWAPVLLALSANSPFWQGVDAGYASYRARVWERWPTAGPTPVLGDAAGYDAHVERLLGTGVPLDAGMLYFDVRLSARYPTVEVRVADVCLRVQDAVLLAGLVRALADTALGEAAAGTPVPGAGVAELRLAAWRAARDGAGGVLLSPLDGHPRPAAEVVGQLLEHVGGALRDNGDEELVRAGAAAVLERGTGADWQRRTLDEHGPVGMLTRAAALTREP
ncbi:YbdK family carboxylate-amine ligase [Kineococcus sp. T13]|uniref:glutamate--cysteine ligase n=1 Tax=Kineococcus vitellinus TaxID=2696565 RepID=UPI0014133A29|nr:YbdK family carboxylate-amine ligase [Kineococcus vitellinus]